jgi:hypothetical protein
VTLTNNGGVTNDRGEYRIFGLEPGTYLVSARPSSAGGTSPMIALATAEVDAALETLRAQRPQSGAAPNRQPETSATVRPFDYAPIYYPGVAARADASPITLVAGQEAAGLDFALQRITTLIVEGQITRPDGQPGAGAQVQLTPTGSTDFATEQESILSATAGPEGMFRFRQVTPGSYTLFARAPAQPGAPATPPGIVRPGPQGIQLWATTMVSVAADVSGITLTLRPPLTLSGRVRFDGVESKPPGNLTQLRVTLFPPSVLQNVRSGVAVRTIAFVPPGTVRADGTFELTNVVPGRYVFGITGPVLEGTAWWARAAMLGGRDLLDGEVEISGDTDLGGVEVTFTDRRSELSGTLQTGAGDAASDVFVIAYAADRRFWGPSARRVQAVRPGVDGKYAIKDLPPGEYLLAAVTDIDQNEWQDPAFLERLQPASLKVTIVEGEKKTLDLRVGG